MTDDNAPSRFHASPAEVDAFLREYFAEDALLNFYRAVGDEVLDEALTHGRQHRGVMESRNCKHIYLSGMADVMDAMWDFRYYPAELPRLETYDRPFNPPRALHPQDSTYHPDNTRLPSPKLPINVRIRSIPGGFVALQDDDPKKVVAAANSLPILTAKLGAVSGTVNVLDPDREIEPLAPVPVPASDRKFEGLLEEASFGAPHVRAGGESNPIPEQVMERFRVASQALRCTKCGGISGDHADWAKGHLFNPPAPADTSASDPCYRKNTHPAHKWLKNRRQAQCPGNTIEETP
jgi:hypothetical protein